MHADPLDELHPGGAVQSHGRDLPDADRLRADRGLPFRPARAAIAQRLPDRRLVDHKVPPAHGSRAAVRGIAAPAAGVQRDWQGRRCRVHRQGIRPVPALPRSQRADPTCGSGTAQGSSGRASEGSLRAAARHQRLHAGARQGGQQLCAGQVLPERIRPSAVGQGAERVRPVHGIRRHARQVRALHLWPGRLDGASAGGGGHPHGAVELAVGGQRRS